MSKKYLPHLVGSVSLQKNSTLEMRFTKRQITVTIIFSTIMRSSIIEYILSDLAATLGNEQ